MDDLISFPSPEPGGESPDVGKGEEAHTREPGAITDATGKTAVPEQDSPASTTDSVAQSTIETDVQPPAGDRESVGDDHVVRKDLPEGRKSRKTGSKIKRLSRGFSSGMLGSLTGSSGSISKDEITTFNPLISRGINQPGETSVKNPTYGGRQPEGAMKSKKRSDSQESVMSRETSSTSKTSSQGELELEDRVYDAALGGIGGSGSTSLDSLPPISTDKKVKNPLYQPKQPEEQMKSKEKRGTLASALESKASPPTKRKGLGKTLSFRSKTQEFGESTIRKPARAAAQGPPTLLRNKTDNPEIKAARVVADIGNSMKEEELSNDEMAKVGKAVVDYITSGGESGLIDPGIEDSTRKVLVKYGKDGAEVIVLRANDQEVGRGGLSSIHVAKNQSYVSKRPLPGKEEEFKEDSEKEVRLTGKIDSPNVIKYIKAEWQGRPVLITDNMSLGDAEPTAGGVFLSNREKLAKIDEDFDEAEKLNNALSSALNNNEDFEEIFNQLKSKIGEIKQETDEIDYESNIFLKDNCLKMEQKLTQLSESTTPQGRQNCGVALLKMIKNEREGVKSAMEIANQFEAELVKLEGEGAKLDNDQLLGAFKQTVSGYLALREAGIFHGDAKLPNLLMRVTDGALDVKISDFGESIEYAEMNNENIRQGTPQYTSMIGRDRISDHVIDYRDTKQKLDEASAKVDAAKPRKKSFLQKPKPTPDEIEKAGLEGELKGVQEGLQTFCEKEDVFALGVMGYKMLSGGRNPYKKIFGANKGTDKGRMDSRLDYTPLEGYPKEVNDLLQGMVAHDPEERLSYEQIEARMQTIT